MIKPLPLSLIGCKSKQTKSAAQGEEIKSMRRRFSSGISV